MSIRQRQPSLCPRDDPLPRRCRCWSRYDHGSCSDQTRLPSSFAWSNPCICSTRHVHLPPWRTYGTLPAGLPTPRRRIAATSQEPGCTGLRHCTWKPRESEGYPPRGGGVDFERCRLFREYAIAPRRNIPKSVDPAPLLASRRLRPLTKPRGPNRTLPRRQCGAY
ncbi:hypothetical protein EMCG_01837 [[Emmonsia] crescens]|uniref:Uncharacterized protein n=1 Tax=[Emmonsia] crescens TaxID=73230 RepID=A0A0G2J286_9EURO|nr:hypothetical protein EMCG_01837 [Emmonsia crescens UAMH 3008]